MRKRIVCLCVFFLCVVVMSAVDSRTGYSETVARLQNQDCIKCHTTEVTTIEKNGGKHKTAVSCLDCHVQHLPEGTDTIPKCSKCHSGKPHFELANCLSCHSNPHEPLALKLGDNITGPCLTCHAQQGQEMKDAPSKHASLACTYCHTFHGEKPECFKCHEPHAQGQKMSDCLGCHKPHKPLVINYSVDTPKNFCTPCHAKEGELLDKSTTKHHAFTCAFCHRGVHKIIPQCESCHGQPHSPLTHKKNPNCIDCHIDAHNLMK